MKKYILLLLLFVLGISFNSCTKDFEDGLNYNNGKENGNGNENPVINTGIFKATIEGNAFVANQVQAIVTDDYVLIAGFRSSKGDLIQIILPSNKLGAYTWENSKNNVEKFVLSYAPQIDGDAFASISKEDAAFFGIQGYTDTAVVKITAIDKDKKTISGTFQFTAFRELSNGKTEIKVITSGLFTNIAYAQNLPIEEPDHFLDAKIDGVEFIEDKIDVASVSSTGAYPYYSIVGKKNGENADSIGISIDQSYSVGTYPASSILLNGGENTVHVASAYCRISSILYNLESGSVTITSKSATRIKGSYSFIVSDFNKINKKSIIGSFDISTEDLN